MEEDKVNEQNVKPCACEQNVPCECEKANAQNDEPVKTQASVEVSQEKVPYKPRKNHRNKNAQKGVGKLVESSVCGEISENCKAEEKLSGAHLGGYKDGDGYKPRNKRRFEESKCECGCEDENREGPSFENPEFKPRVVEISLDQTQSAHKKDFDKKEFVSFSSADEKDVGVMERIKRFFAKLFKKEEKNDIKFRKNRRGFKGKKGGNKFSNQKGDFKNRGNKKFRPRRNGGFRRSGNSNNKES